MKDKLQYGTKEFYEAIEMFEKAVKTNFYVSSLRREDRKISDENAKEGRLIIYENGQTNTLFEMFLFGARFGISISEVLK